MKITDTNILDFKTRTRTYKTSNRGDGRPDNNKDKEGEQTLRTHIKRVAI